MNTAKQGIANKGHGDDITYFVPTPPATLWRLWLR